MPFVPDLVLGTTAFLSATEPQRQKPARSPQVFDGLTMLEMFKVPAQLLELSVKLLVGQSAMTRWLS